jgi:hypothetical protein
LNIIHGAIVRASIFGVVIGIPMIIGTIRLRRAADSCEAYLRSSDSAAWEKGLKWQGRFFSVQMIFLILASLWIPFVGPGVAHQQWR